ncbi:MAG: heme ABC exporter ATP-binding protein CcmA [Acidobacteria bacterium]|nr:heme ABC exporter ATP-binding protein CcmA [Acidobacteriota bacterium]
MIEARNLGKYFGRFAALNNLHLTVSDGEFIALFGKNGAGKTTLLRILAGLSRPSRGELKIKPSRQAPPGAVRGHIGYLSHETSLYMDLTAVENLRFHARLTDVPSDDRALAMRMQQVGLAGRERDPVRNFSRGMQQRLAIARAFLHNPDILLLDEPFTGLDSSGCDFFKSFLAAAHADGKTCIMAIHDTRLGYEIAERLVVISRGAVALDAAKPSLDYAQFREKLEPLLA